MHTCIIFIGDTYKDLIDELSKMPCKKIIGIYKNNKHWLEIKKKIKDKRIVEEKIDLDNIEEVMKAIDKAIKKKGQELSINTIGAKEIGTTVLISLLLKKQKELQGVNIVIRHPLKKNEHLYVPATLLLSMPQEDNKKKKFISGISLLPSRKKKKKILSFSTK